MDDRGLDNTHSDVFRFQGNSGNSMKLIKNYAGQASISEIAVWILFHHEIVFEILLQCKS